SAADVRPPTTMNGRRRPSQPAQVRSDQAPASGETMAPSNDRLLPSSPINRYDDVNSASHSASVKLLNALNTPTPKLQPRYASTCPLRIRSPFSNRRARQQRGERHRRDA